MIKTEVIQVTDVQKKFYLYANQAVGLKEYVLDKLRVTKHKSLFVKEVNVLKGVSFSVHEGETLSIIGKNGSGKSTLLKIISGIYLPTAGKIKVHGRLSPLIELGSGFHSDFTGRENAQLYGQILGMHRKDIDSRLENIKDFSELADYFDRPVRMYSSGMVSRLAFSVATQVDPKILIMDEVLSVGDVRFQEKCYKKIQEIKDRGTTIIMVTHSSEAVKQWADRCIYIRDGHIEAEGVPNDVLSVYLKDEHP